jgi:hypothetical protein
MKMATGYCRGKRIGTNAFALRYADFVKTFRAYGIAAAVASVPDLLFHKRAVDTIPESIDINKTLVSANLLA